MVKHVQHKRSPVAKLAIAIGNSIEMVLLCYHGIKAVFHSSQIPTRYSSLRVISSNHNVCQFIFALVASM